MTARSHPPVGAPCWTDLWTSDVDGSRRFYEEIFGWEAQEPSPEFGGYFMFHRDGVPVAGGMGDMGDMQADDSWKIYLATPDASGTTAAVEAHGGAVRMGVNPVADLGNQAVLADPTGAGFGIWEPVTFPGFTVLDEPGSPSWFELHTNSYRAALDFYRTVFGWQVDVLSDNDDFRYATVVDSSGTQLAGVLDAPWLADGAQGGWTTYWETADVDATAADVARLGGKVIDGPTDTPYGRMATVTDPNGAEFRLRTGPTA
jgi:uncharacterized protein